MLYKRYYYYLITPTNQNLVSAFDIRFRRDLGRVSLSGGRGKGEILRTQHTVQSDRGDAQGIAVLLLMLATHKMPDSSNHNTNNYSAHENASNKAVKTVLAVVVVCFLRFFYQKIILYFQDMLICRQLYHQPSLHQSWQGTSCSLSTWLVPGLQPCTPVR